jgi:hypothetical protein
MISVENECRNAVVAHNAIICELSNRFGSKSRAVYYAKFLLTTRLFSVLIQQLSTSSEDSITYVRTLFATAHAELTQHFEILVSHRERNSPSIPRKKICDEQLGALYVFNEQAYQEMKANGQRIRSRVIQLDRNSMQGVRGNATYLYCIDANDNIVLFSRPLTSSDLLFGVRFRDFIVKHPMLLQDHNLVARCAGDIFIVKSSDGGIAGVLATRGSGHFRPDIESSSCFYRAIRSALALPEGRIAFIG